MLQLVIVHRIRKEAQLWSLVNNTTFKNNLNASYDRFVHDKWQPPPQDTVKCKVNANWRNDRLHSGGAWLAQNHIGHILFHARESFTLSSNRIIAEF